MVLRNRRGGGEPPGVATDRLENDVLVDFLHIARQDARLLNGKRHVTRGRSKSRRMIRREQVVVDRLRNADAAEIVTLRLAIFLNAADRVHRVVAACEEIVTDIVFLKLLKNDRKIGLLNLVSTAAKRAARRALKTFDRRWRYGAEVEQLILHETFDSVLHTEDLVDLGVRRLLTKLETTLHNPAKARVNDASGTAALTDDRVTLKH